MEQIQTGDKKMETVLRCIIDVSKKTLKEMTEVSGISWVNSRVTDICYPFQDSFSGKWKVEVQRLQKKEKFEEIVREIRKDNWQPATIYHLLTLLNSQEGKHLSGLFMTPASLCVDDFEYPGCVVLSIDGEDRRIGLGNWRGSKIGGYNVVRIKREQDILNSSEID